MTDSSIENAWDDSMPGGFFGDVEIGVEDIPDDPFGFGRGFHLVSVNEWRAPKVSDSGKYGSYILFELMEPRYENVKPFGRWIQLPTPKAIQDETGVRFDPANDPKDMEVLVNLKMFFRALGFAADEMNKANPVNCLNRQFLAKLWAKEEEGRWVINFSFVGLRAMPEPGTEEYNAVMNVAMGIGDGSGSNEFAGGKKQSGGNAAAAIEAAMREDMNNA